MNGILAAGPGRVLLFHSVAGWRGRSISALQTVVDEWRISTAGVVYGEHIRDARQYVHRTVVIAVHLSDNTPITLWHSGKEKRDVIIQ